MNIDAVTRFAADGILSSLLAGIAIAALAWAVTRMFGRQGSGTRFAVWFLALVAIGLVPFVGHIAGSPTAAAKVASANTITLPQTFATYLFVAWMIGVTFGLLHVAHGLYRLRRLRATCTPVDLDQLDATSRAILVEAGAPSFSRFWKRACPELVEGVGVNRHVTLCTSDAVRVPAAIGYFRPLVVFPTWALSEIPPAELNAILLHELAHLRRWDDFTNLAQKVVKAIFFFHPAVWFIESRLTLEREMACDDAVLAASFSPRAYAESLVGLAEKSFLRRGVQLAQAAVSHVQQLKLRLAEILRKDKAQQGSRIWKPAVAVMSLVGIIAAYGVAHAPRLIAFSSDAHELGSEPTMTRQAVASELDAQLRPVNLRYTEPAHAVAPESLGVTKLRDSSKLPVRQGRAKRNPLRVLRASVVNSTGMPGNIAAFADDPSPRMILSNFPMEIAPAPVLVVFQGQQFGPDGPFFWRVTVVHLTPAQQRVVAGAIAKQI
jgi:hypothetical protein